MAKLKDLTNQKFGRLIAKQYNEKNKKWLCECECGNIKEVSCGDLTSGNVKSCGCLHSEISALNSKKYVKKYNRYNFEKGYVIGYPTNNDIPFYVDYEDYDMIADYAWRDNGHGYLVTNIKNKPTLIHKLIMGDYNGEIDHINRNKYDNRRKNLRFCTHEENVRNRTKHKNNTSGVRGISWHKPTGKWQVRIGHNGELIHIGTFTDFEEAVRIRLKAEEQYHRNFAFNEARNEREQARIYEE